MTTREAHSTLYLGIWQGIVLNLLANSSLSIFNLPLHEDDSFQMEDALYYVLFLVECGVALGLLLRLLWDAFASFDSPERSLAQAAIGIILGTLLCLVLNDAFTQEVSGSPLPSSPIATMEEEEAPKARRRVPRPARKRTVFEETEHQNDPNLPLDAPEDERRRRLDGLIPVTTTKRTRRIILIDDDDVPARRRRHQPQQQQQRSSERDRGLQVPPDNDADTVASLERDVEAVHEQRRALEAQRRRYEQNLDRRQGTLKTGATAGTGAATAAAEDEDDEADGDDLDLTSAKVDPDRVAMLQKEIRRYRRLAEDLEGRLLVMKAGNKGDWF